MKASMIALVGFALLAVGTGCGAASMQSAQSPTVWQTRALADGIELRVNEDASPDAARVVEDIQSEMRLRYPSPDATQPSHRWETRVLADGVELLVAQDATANASHMADDIQTEMRSRYIGAR
jgi:hypothetical protein